MGSLVSWTCSLPLSQRYISPSHLRDVCGVERRYCSACLLQWVSALQAHYKSRSLNDKLRIPFLEVFESVSVVSLCCVFILSSRFGLPPVLLSEYDWLKVKMAASDVQPSMLPKDGFGWSPLFYLRFLWILLSTGFRRHLALEMIADSFLMLPWRHLKTCVLPLIFG